MKALLKTAENVKIPKGGLRPGFLINDFTQVMTPEDAKMVREKLPFYQRSGPGLGVIGAMGAASFGALGSNIAGKKGGLIGAGIGGLGLPSLAYALSRSGKHNQQALESAKVAIHRAKQKKKE